MNVDAGCREPADQSNPRGAQNLSRPGRGVPSPGRVLRPGDRRAALGRVAWTRRWTSPVPWPRSPSERSRGSGCSSSPWCGDAAPGLTRRRVPTTFRLVLLVVLVVLLLVVRRRAGLAARRPAAARPTDVQSEREAVMSQTKQFVLRLNTYGPDDLDDEDACADYQEQVDEVITPKFAADFETSGLPIAEQTVEPGRLRARGRGLRRRRAASSTRTPRSRSSPPGLTGSYPDPKHPDDAVEADRRRRGRAAVGGRPGQDRRRVAGRRLRAGDGGGLVTSAAAQPQLVRPARRRAGRVRGRDPRRLARGDRRPRPDRPSLRAPSTRRPRCCSTRTAERRTTPSWRRRRSPSRRARARARARGGRTSADRRRRRAVEPPGCPPGCWSGLAVAVLVVAGVAAWLCLSQPSDDAVEDATAAAQSAAERAVVPILSYDADGPRRSPRRPPSSTSPATTARSTTSSSTGSSSRTLRRPRRCSSAELVRSGVVRAGEDRVEVFVLVNQARTNKESEGAAGLQELGHDHDGSEVDGDWLVAGMDT